MNTAYEERLRRACCSLEGLSIGDAYGNHHGNNARKRAAAIWEFSDDTLMALSIVANLRQYGAIEQDALAQSFAVRWDGRRGYGQGVTRLLKSIQRGANWRQATHDMFDGQGSYGNGAAMRVAPLGAYFADDLSYAVEQARLSAVVTHAHPEGIAGAVAVAVAAALSYRYGMEKQPPGRVKFLGDIFSFLPDTEVQRKLGLALELPVGTSFQDAANTLGNGRPSLAQFTVPFALWAAAESLADYEAAIRRTAGVQGDVDTNCAIVGGIVVMYTGTEGIPVEWRTRREALPMWAFQESSA